MLYVDLGKFETWLTADHFDDGDADRISHLSHLIVVLWWSDEYLWNNLSNVYQLPLAELQ